jgi:hypothetical protein
MDKYVKLEAIERIAKPMQKLHDKKEGKGYKEPATEEADSKEDSAESKDTPVKKKSSKCPHCGSSIAVTLV